MKRREFLLGTGAAGLAAVALQGGRTAFATDPPKRAPRRLLLVFVTGGWDTAYVLDPKEPPLVSVPEGAVQRFGDLDVFTDASRPNVTQYFERHAARTAIVRGIATDGIFHFECQRRIATGKRDDGQPDIGAIVAHDLGNDAAAPVPRARRHRVHRPVRGELRPRRHHQPDRRPRWRIRRPMPLAQAEDAMLRRYADASADRARATRGATGYNRRRVDDFAASLARSQRLQELRGRLGARGETRSFASQIPLAIDALQQDISHAVMMTTRQDWDTHTDNGQQAACNEATFADLTQLVDQLTTLPGRDAGTTMIDDTVVVMFSELSRTPLLNANAPPGKDHWPVTSAVVIGGGVRGGQAFGATTAGAGDVAIDLATGRPSATGIQPMYSHFIAGLLALCGADPAAHLEATPVFDAFIA